MVQMVLADYKIFNAEVLFRGDYSIDQFIDVVVGNRIYMPCLYVFNKIDQISLEEVDKIARIFSHKNYLTKVNSDDYFV